MMGSPRILVVTDRYPPETAGGGEISLHILLRKLSQLDVRPTVAALSERQTSVRRSDYEGVTVVRIPYSAEWPPLQPLTATTKGRDRFLRQLVARLTSAGRYLFHTSTTSRRQRYRRLELYSSLLRKGLSQHMPLLDGDLLEGAGTLDRLREIVAGFGPHLVHGDNYRGILFGAAVCPQGVPFTAWVRDNRFFCAERNQATNVGGAVCRTCRFECASPVPERLRRRLEPLMAESLAIRRAALRRADAVVVTSRYLAEQLGTMADPGRITVVPNAIDPPEEIAPVQGDLEQVLPPQILIVGMINSNKGQMQLLEWLPHLDERVGRYRIVLAGRGERLLARIREGIHRAGAEDRIVTMGFLSRPEMHRAYARASVVAVPAIWPEPFGRVPLEAGLSRRPVVAFAVGALPENVVHAETGFLVPPGDQRGFAEALATLLLDPALAKRYGDNGYRRAVSRFGPDEVVEKLQDVWRGVLGRSRRAGFPVRGDPVSVPDPREGVTRAI